MAADSHPFVARSQQSRQRVPGCYSRRADRPRAAVLGPRRRHRTLLYCPGRRLRDRGVALLCPPPKAAPLEMAGLARTRRPAAGPVLVYDAPGTVNWPAQLRWSPPPGCHAPATAYRRARAMVEASAVTVEAGGNGGAGND